MWIHKGTDSPQLSLFKNPYNSIHSFIQLLILCKRKKSYSNQCRKFLPLFLAKANYLTVLLKMEWNLLCGTSVQTLISVSQKRRRKRFLFVLLIQLCATESVYRWNYLCGRNQWDCFMNSSRKGLWMSLMKSSLFSRLVDYMESHNLDLYFLRNSQI